MASKLSLFQRRVADLIIADNAHFCDALHPVPGKVPVLVDLPGDIDSDVSKAIGKASVIVIVLMASFGPRDEGETTKQRRYAVRVWVQEKVVINRSKPGASTADECCEFIDDLVDGKWNGITPQQTTKHGIISLADDGVHELNLGKKEPLTWEVEFFTNINRHA